VERKYKGVSKKLNYYELLEVFPAATQDEIEGAFRNMLYKYHPDHNPDKPDWAHEKTAELVDAYKILSDPMRRKIYNFLIFATLREKVEEIKFNIFQMGDKKKFEDAMVYYDEGLAAYDTSKQGALLKFQQSFGLYQLPEAVYNMGVIYTNTNKLDEAMRAFREASKLAPENQQFLRTIDKLAELMKEIDKARKSASGE
jgi:curved DNA-binding protein CbpA